MINDKMHLEEDEESPVQFKSKAGSNSGDKSHIDMTPMVDVVFQLLTFFLLAVKRDSMETVDVPITTTTTAVLESESTYITVKPAPRKDAEPEIIIGEKKSGDGKFVTLENVKAAVEKGVAEGRPKIVVKAERLVKWGDVQKITRIIAQVKDAQLFVGVQGKEN
jgi:biopolymer transport protein ExbD